MGGRNPNKRRPVKLRCERCGTRENLTHHHVLKRCVFGDNDDVVVLCKTCHKKVEELVSEMEKSILRGYKEEYIAINQAFIGGPKAVAKRQRERIPVISINQVKLPQPTTALFACLELALLS